jgi:hypothetical protein
MDHADTAGAGSRALEPAGLARLALAFHLRISQLPEGSDASWQALAGLRPVFEQVPEGPLRRRAMLSLFRRWCGPLPGLEALATPAGRLALLDRLQLLSRLCTLALLSRPGVLRCCVERRTRQSLEAALGPAIAALRESSHEGPAVPGPVAAWVPIQWACVGHADLSRSGAWPHRSLRRLARLALPAQWPVPLGRRGLPPLHVPTKEALRRMETLFDGEAAW